MSSARTLLGVLLRDALRHPLQAAASIGGVALGLAVVIGVHAAGHASRDSFTRTFEAVAGRATHQVLGIQGVEPEALLRLLRHPEVQAAQPVIEGLLPVVGWTGRDAQDAPTGRVDLAKLQETEPPLRLLGIDPFRVAPFVSLEGGADTTRDPLGDARAFARFLVEPGAILAPESWARTRGLEPGDRVSVAASGTRRELVIVGLLPPSAFPEATDAVALADLATADETLTRRGRLDRVDVIASADADLSSALVTGERVERPATRGEQAGRLTDAFRLNLLALSTLALLVGCYLVFNAAQFAVVRRTPLLGQLRCLGASRRALLSAVLAELAVLGLAGGALGAALGALLARALVGDVARTVSTLYGFVRVETATLPAAQVAAFVALAAVVAVAAGALPAIEAAWTPPRLVGARSAQELRFARRLPQLLATALLGAALAVVALAWPTRAMSAGFVAAFGILLTGGALVPPLLAAALPRLRAAADRAGLLPLSLGAGEVERSLSRTGVATSALSVALAMAIGVMVMVGSFEKEVRAWLDGALVADLYVSPFRQEQSGDGGLVPDGAIALARALPGVERVELLRARDALLNGRLIRVLAAETDDLAALRRRVFLEGDPDSARAGLERGGACISEPLSQAHGLHLGDTLELEGVEGPERFEIVGVFRDYALDRGFAFLYPRTYLEAFGETGICNMALALREGEDVGAAARALREAFSRAEGGYWLEVVAQSVLREQVDVAFDQTFAVTRLLETIATGLALAGIATTLASLFLERLRELATLRALGATLVRVAGLFVTQGLLLAGAAVLAAIPTGAALAWLLVKVVNLRSFGWSIGMAWPLAGIAKTLALALLMGAVAALVPWLLARRREIAPALREE